MNKIRLVAHTTYRQQVHTGTFLVLTFALPVLMLIAGTVAFFMADRDDALPTVGIVDETGRLTFVEEVPVDDAVLNLSAYANRTAAQTALQGEEIGAYLVVPDGYFEGEPPVLTAPAGSNAALGGRAGDLSAPRTVARSVALAPGKAGRTGKHDLSYTHRIC